MKNFVWLKHNNIMLINLCVIGLMLWLTISFLVLALSERKQANWLQSSVKTQESLYAAAKSLSSIALEHILFSVSSEAGQDTAHEHLQEKTIASSKTKEYLFDPSINLLSQSEYFSYARIDGASLLTLNNQLKTQLNIFESTIRYSELPSTTQNTLSGFGIILQNPVIKAHNDALLSMITLADGTAFLPNSKASEISVLQSIFIELMKARLEVSQYQMMLASRSTSATVDNQLSSLILTQLSDGINARLRRIGRLASSLKSNSALLDNFMSLESWLQSGVVANNTAFNRKILNAQEPQASLSTLANSLDTLANSSLDEIRSHAIAQHNRSTRNMAIDIMLVLLCFLITTTTVWLNRKIKYMAYNDNLSGLANRVSLEHWLKESTGSHALKNRQHALIYIDLDRFKSVNDNYGHEFGDELIKIVAERLVLASDSNSIVARLGGDEFGLYLMDIESDTQVMHFAEELIDLITDDIMIDEHVVRVGASAGVSFFPADSDTGLTLLKNADIAMYHNKATGQDKAHRFNAEVAQSYKRRLNIELDLKKALANDEFELHYQPKVSVMSGQVEGVEALLRWKQGNQAYISPFEFIPIAEELGLMGDIGNWVLNRACTDAVRLQKTENLDFNLAINISAQQFRDERFETQIFSALENSGMRNLQLELEVTESLLMHDQERVIAMLQSLRVAGVKIAIDDFGTGFSSLQYLQQLPLDTLKIDRAFILALDDTSPIDSVANSIVQLASLFNLETVAEGVETAEQDKKIRSLGVDHIQGYRYSKPVPYVELAETIRRIPSMFKAESDNDQANAA